MTNMTDPSLDAYDRGDHASAEPWTILDPSDGSVVGRVVPAAEHEIAAAVDAARRAAAGWAQVSPQERGATLRVTAAELAEHAHELAQWNHRETGRPADEALAGVMAGVRTLEQYAELGPVHRGKSLRGSAFAGDYTVAGPHGVVLALTPWNDPVVIACGLLGAALAMGNTVLHKPSERCPHLGAELGRILCGTLPAGVLGTLTGDGRTGYRLVSDPRIDVVAHVGSSATGAVIARTAAPTRAHTVLENGGNDPLLVDDGVDPVWAAEQAALGAFANSGQICTSVERIYVHRAVAPEFLTALDAQARARNRSGRLGPLVDERLRNAVHQQVAEAIAAGATASEGGRPSPGPGTHYPATVLRGCSADMTVMTEETFGPVAPVQIVNDFDEALDLADAGSYGLAATILTPSLGNARRAVATMTVGTVKINNVFGGAPGGSAQPRGASGHGFGYGPELLDEMSTVKVVHIESPGGTNGSPW